MRKILLLLISIITLGQAIAQCPTTQITLSTQAEVDAFAANYPGCTVVTEELRVYNATGNSDITNLNGLNQITEVNARLLIFDNSLLTSLSGLSNLTAVDEFDIWENDALTDLTGLESVQNINDLSITGNAQLQNVIGLQDVAFSDGIIDIIGNASLTSLEGLLGNLTQPVSLSIQNNDSLQSIGQVSATNFDLERLILTNNNSLLDLSGLENLDKVNVLDIQNNDALVTLQGLQDLTIDGNTRALVLDNNQSLTTLTSFLTPNSSVDLVIWNNDSLENLDGFENIVELIALGIDDNDALTNLDGLSNVTNDVLSLLLITDNNSLTDISGLEGIIEITGVFKILRNDALESLDGLNGITDVSEMVFEDNPMLTDISAIENVLIANALKLKNNTSLAVCNYLSICNFIPGGFVVEVENNAPGCSTVQEILDSCGINFNTIQGEVLFDYNDNGCDPNDYPASSVIVSITNGTDTYSTSVAEDGSYFRFMDVDGTLDVSVAPGSYPPYVTPNPLTATTVFTGFGNTDTIDFCLEINEPEDDLAIVMIPTNDARPGFLSAYVIAYYNIGTVLQNDQITLEFDDSRQTFDSSIPAPAEINGNQITWNYGDLFPFGNGLIQLSFNTLPPPTNDSGDILEFTASIFPITGDSSPENNVYTWEQTIVNSQDPNDKLVVQGSEIFEEQVGEYLDYIVRFQNIGTASAINVRVDDVLSDNLDWNSLRILSSSHDYELEILNGNFLSFIFDDINLPPVTIDPAGSNGYIAFQVRTLDDLVVGDQVENSANIFFDFNDPIVTNTVITEVVEELSVDESSLDSSVIIYPNPVSEILYMEISKNIILEEVTLYSVLGEEVILTNTQKVDMSNLAEGMYFIEVQTDRGLLTKKILKK